MRCHGGAVRTPPPAPLRGVLGPGSSTSTPRVRLAWLPTSATATRQPARWGPRAQLPPPRGPGGCPLGFYPALPAAAKPLVFSHPSVISSNLVIKSKCDLWASFGLRPHSAVSPPD